MRYLVLGDGNFSFSLSLCRAELGPGKPGKVVTTSLESLDRVLKRPHAERILKQLKEDYGGDVEVLHGIDATLLHCCEPLKATKLLFDVVVFNFPHTGSSKIQTNRTLLKDFFVSLASSSLLAADGGGRVWVSLCRGQGGTPGDSPHRGYDNTWRVVEMAAEGGFVLDRLEPFLASDFPDYVATGHRGESDRGFCTSEALRHVFRSPSPSLPSLHPPVYHHDISFWWDAKEDNFDEDVLKTAVEAVCEGCVQGVELLDVYRPHPAASERVGYCYRLTYGSPWDAVSRTRASRLQLLLRETLAKHSQVELR